MYNCVFRSCRRPCGYISRGVKCVRHFTDVCFKLHKESANYANCADIHTVNYKVYPVYIVLLHKDIASQKPVSKRLSFKVSSENLQNINQQTKNTSNQQSYAYITTNISQKNILSSVHSSSDISFLNFLTYFKAIIYHDLPLFY